MIWGGALPHLPHTEVLAGCLGLPGPRLCRGPRGCVPDFFRSAPMPADEGCFGAPLIVLAAVAAAA